MNIVTASFATGTKLTLNSNRYNQHLTDNQRKCTVLGCWNGNVVIKFNSLPAVDLMLYTVDETAEMFS